jgi:catalase-peroxidase
MIVLGGVPRLAGCREGRIRRAGATSPGRTMRRRSRPTWKPRDAQPDADGFRNYVGQGHTLPAEHLLIERALTLSAPE